MNIDKTFSLTFLETTNKFLGYGKPSEAKCFFIGSEEHGPFSDPDNFNTWKNDLKSININDSQYFYSDSQKPTAAKGYEGRITYLQHKLQNSYYRNYPGDIDSFRNDVNNYIGFWCNIKPIGDEDESSWSEFNREITGFDTKDKYFDSIWGDKTNSRKKVIFRFLQYLKNRINAGEDILIFHFGSSSSFSPYAALLPVYKELGFTFNAANKNTSELRNNFGKKYWWTSSECKRIWFAGHPGNNWFSDKVTDEIVNQLCSAP